MSDKSAIAWTDATWNPVRGCTKVSPGCKHCYAETFAERWRGVKGHPFEQGFDLRLVRCLMMPYIQGEPDSVPAAYDAYRDIVSTVFREPYFTENPLVQL